MANLFCLFQKDSFWKLFFCDSEHMFYFNYICHINKKSTWLTQVPHIPFQPSTVIYIMLWVKSLCGFFTLNITKGRFIYQENDKIIHFFYSYFFMVFSGGRSSKEMSSSISLFSFSDTRIFSFLLLIIRSSWKSWKSWFMSDKVGCFIVYSYIVS